MVVFAVNLKDGGYAARTSPAPALSVYIISAVDGLRVGGRNRRDPNQRYYEFP